MTETQTIRVILADDHAVVRKGIREFLEEEGNIIVAAAADNLLIPPRTSGGVQSDHP